MKKIYYKNLKEKDVEVLEEFRNESWIHLEAPSRQELDYLVEKFNVDPSLLNDAMDLYEVPRIEVENNITYIFSRYVFTEENQIVTAPFTIIVGKHFIASITPKIFTVLDDLINGKISITTVNKNKLVIQLLNQIQSTYNHYLTQIGKRVRSITVQLEKIKNKDIMQFVVYENTLNDFSQGLVRMNNNLTSFLSGKHLDLSSIEKDLMEDLLLTNGQLLQFCNETLRNLINIREAYSTIMTNNLNRIIKLFTSLTVVLTIPTMISSFYGMNVHLPFQEDPFAFFAILIATIISCVITLSILIYKDWL